jgi:hypothetical protein
MRFPLRFTSDFALGVTARAMRARGRRPFVVKLAPFSDVDGAANAFPAVESMARIVWVGGAESLEHPGIARYVNELAASGREVFLQTDGEMLRRRIHEFQPSPRFRFVVRFDGPSAGRNSVAVEAIRVARLSGFLVCAVTALRVADEVQMLAKLHTELHWLDLDGYLIVPASRTTELNRALKDARHRLLNRRWRRLSGMFDSVLSPAHPNVSEPAAQRAPHHSGAAIVRLGSENSPRDCGEGAQA